MLLYRGNNLLIKNFLKLFGVISIYLILNIFINNKVGFIVSFINILFLILICYFIIKIVYCLVLVVINIIKLIINLIIGKYFIYNGKFRNVNVNYVVRLNNLIDKTLLKDIKDDDLKCLNVMYDFLFNMFINLGDVNILENLILVLEKKIYKRINGRYVLLKIIRKIPILNFIFYVVVYIIDNEYRRIIRIMKSMNLLELVKIEEKFINDIKYRRKIFRNVIYFKDGGMLIIVLVFSKILCKVKDKAMLYELYKFILDVMENSNGYDFLGRIKFYNFDFSGFFYDLVYCFYIN